MAPITFCECLGSSAAFETIPERIISGQLPTLVNESTLIMSTGQDSSLEDLTALMTTTSVDIRDQSTGSSMTSTQSRGVGFYLECTVLVIGVVGTAANVLVHIQNEEYLVPSEELLESQTVSYKVGISLVIVFSSFPP